MEAGVVRPGRRAEGAAGEAFSGHPLARAAMAEARRQGLAVPEAQALVVLQLVAEVVEEELPELVVPDLHIRVETMEQELLELVAVEQAAEVHPQVVQVAQVHTGLHQYTHQFLVRVLQQVLVVVVVQ